jgi:hypothetical protein
MIDCTTTTVDSFQILDPISSVPPGVNKLAYLESGLTQLTSGQQTKVIPFQAIKAGTYIFVEADIINTTDNPPLVLSFELTNQSLTGFTIQLDGLPDTSNSYLRWCVQVPPA